MEQALAVAGGTVQTAPAAVAVPLLRVAGISRSYGRWPAVQEASFELSAGGVTGLLGPNGAGKTSLLTCIAGTAGWDSGSIAVDGIDAERRPAAVRRKVGYMPERIAFWPEMDVDGYLRFVARVKGIPRGERPAAIDLALARTGLVDVRGRVIDNLSKGYRQRVGLAQALLGEPPVVILDEPMAGLDPLNAIDVRRVLTEYAEDRVVLLSTHVIADIRMMCSRVIMMSGGRVISDGRALALSPTSGWRRLRIRLGLARSLGLMPSEPARLEVLVTSSGARMVRLDRHEEDVEMTVEVPDDHATDHLVRDLVLAGLAVYGVEGTTDTLEEAFREAVQQAHDAQAQADGRR